jgi:hypothetical protein
VSKHNSQAAQNTRFPRRPRFTLPGPGIEQPHGYVSMGDIAKALGVHRVSAHQWPLVEPEFPSPALTLWSGQHIYVWEDVLEWAVRRSEGWVS